MSTFRAIDLETNGVDVNSCEIAQVAITDVPDSTSMVYCAVQSMPPGATKVNGLTVERLAEHKPFIVKVRAVMAALTAPDVIIVTFNGARFDLPVIARYAEQHGHLDFEQHDRDGFEDLLSRRHIDVYRVWQVARAKKLSTTHWDGRADYGSWLPQLNAGMFSGSLEAAHGFWVGSNFDGAHDAGADNVATLDVLREMLVEDFVTVEDAMRMTTSPLPGDVDFEGKFKWDGDQAVCTFGKFRDSPIEDIERGFLMNLIRNKIYHRHTKHVVREFMRGNYPERDYENEPCEN